VKGAGVRLIARTPHLQCPQRSPEHGARGLRAAGMRFRMTLWYRSFSLPLISLALSTVLRISQPFIIMTRVIGSSSTTLDIQTSRLNRSYSTFYVQTIPRLNLSTAATSTSSHALNLSSRRRDRSSRKVTSRTQCSVFSIAQWPRAAAAKAAAESVRDEI
jgi:hypothetical protein